MDQEATMASSSLGPVRDLAEQLRQQGVIVVAGRSLAAARPEGLDLLTTLPLLAGEVAAEWFEAADRLALLDVDRLQVRAAAGLLSRAATTAGGDAVRIDALDVAQVARAAMLRLIIQRQDEPSRILDRTWAVLHDLRRMARTTPPQSLEPPPQGLGLVPSALEVDLELARSLPQALNRAACAGALVGMLTPWLPPPRPDPARPVDTLLAAVAELARVPHDQAWHQALVTVGRVVASISVAAAYTSAGLVNGTNQALAYTLSEPALGVLMEQATAAALAVVGACGGSLGTPGTAPVLLPGLTELRPGATPAAAHHRDSAPTASPSQQARAAAERAAAERRATQQAFMERAAALRAGSRQGQGAVTIPNQGADPVSPSGTAGTAGPSSLDEASQQPGSAHADPGSVPIPDQGSEPGGRVDVTAPDSQAGPVAGEDTLVVHAPQPLRVDLIAVEAGAGERIPSLATVQADLGESAAEDTLGGDGADSVELALWDSLMRPR